MVSSHGLDRGSRQVLEPPKVTSIGEDTDLRPNRDRCLSFALRRREGAAGGLEKECVRLLNVE